MKITIIKSNKAHFMPNDLEIENVSVKLMFRKSGKFLQFVRAMLLHLNIDLPLFFYNNELTQMDADIIIVTDCHLQTKFVQWLYKNNANKRLIVWYWNTIEEVGKKIPPDSLPLEVEKWSYSEYDCKKYNLRYNTTFYPYANESNLKEYNPTVDVYFLGKDKGRLKKIMEVKELLERHDLSTFFYICPTKKYQLKKNKIYRPQIPYREVLSQIVKCKAILDCFVSENAGPTIRPMEALFFEKKLITDDLKIINADYYCPNNVFVLGYDDEKKLNEFVNSPYKKLKSQIVERYTMQAWLARFVSYK